MQSSSINHAGPTNFKVERKLAKHRLDGPDRSTRHRIASSGRRHSGVWAGEASASPPSPPGFHGRTAPYLSSSCRRSFLQNLARPPSDLLEPSTKVPPSPPPPAPPVSSPPSPPRPPRSGWIEGQGQEMGQAFRKLFDAFFGNKEMRVRYLLPSCFPSLPSHLDRRLQ